MKIKRFLDQFIQSPTNIKIAAMAVVAVWGLVLVALVVGTILLLERPAQTLPPTPGGGTPAIALEPAAGTPGTTVTVRGEGWTSNHVVLLYLMAPGQTEPPNFAIAGSTADAEGRFTARFVVPSEPGWEDAGLATVIAQTAEGASAHALFSLVSAPQQPTVTQVTPSQPTPTPTQVVPEAPTATPQPGKPTATAITDLNIRAGPGTVYPVLGVLRAGQSAEITGLSLDGSWWQIHFSGTADGRGWLSAQYVTAQHTGNVPLVEAPPLPATPTPLPTATPTPTSTPVVISDWRGEYYNNPGLGGNPVLVRNDVAINFDWGTGSPAPGVAADNFSARWSRSLNFSAGVYRFYARTDDGVRLWIDGVLVIDQWHDGAPTTYTADLNLAGGSHNIRMEYYERGGGALAQLAWERLDHYPDWKARYYNNRRLEGNPVLVRNDVAINFDWGTGSPGAGVPADNFSARWSRSVNFSAGTYRFYARVDDGVRLWIDGALVIDQWHDAAPTTYTADVNLSDGSHNVRMEYYERSGGALAQLAWERLDHYPDWKAEYYDNRKLEGDPVLVRNESEIDHNWGEGSPASGVPADNFSARWTRKVDFKSGTYIFRVRVDDGVRLWVDDALLIDSWKDGSSRRIEAERQVSKGKHRVKVEYYERTGAAQIEVSWRREEEPANQPPQSVPGGPYSVDEGRLLSLDGRGSRDPDGTLVRYEWDFNYDGQAFTVDSRGQTPQTSYPDGPATVTVALRVTDDQGASQIATTRVEVKNVAPVAEAGGPYTGQVGSPISLAGTATDPGLIDQAGLTYRWDFGDGTSGSGPIVSHSYVQAGSYTARLTVTDKDGARGSDTARVEVTATNQPPKAVIEGPAGGLVGETLTFSGSGSSDGDGTIVRYDWDFGDGTTAGQVKVSHSYSRAGRYQVTLTVTDDGGLSAGATLAVQIEEPTVNQPPTAVIEGPTQGLVGEALGFRGSASSDSDGVIVKYEWNFGDGATDNKVKVAHAYTQAGSYQVTLTVTDNGGLSDTATLAVRIEEPSVNQPPAAMIEGPSHGLVGETLAFRGSGSSDSDGSIIKYEWDLGDGSTEDNVKVAHAYTHAGSYQVILTVTDDGGLSDSATLAVQIEEPVPINLPPVAVIHGPATAQVGESITFDASSSSDIEGSIVDYAWVFDDGTTGSGITVTHIYTQAGSYQLTLTVTDDGGLAASDGQVIQVQEMVESNLSSGPAGQMPTRSQVARWLRSTEPARLAQMKQPLP
jgi:PKD repeat protein